MGKRGNKQRHPTKPPRNFYNLDEEDEIANAYPLSSKEEVRGLEEDNDQAEAEAETEAESNPLIDVPSKFFLYQQSVQSPKGDISYLQKFFLMYVGGRAPLHLQEDFCGTALLSIEWLRGDSRRTAVGLDLDLEALDWCLENNIAKIGGDGYSRLSLFHGNVLQPDEAKLVKSRTDDLMRNIALESIGIIRADPAGSANRILAKRECALPKRDIICAFNYSCCCLRTRGELISYFKHALDALSVKGGIFVMDLYGGTSSEDELRLRRKFPGFTYIWEQEKFDIIRRETRINLHFHLQKQQKQLRHAFSYQWRLWSLPEIKDCLEEAGFQSVHFWIRQMPDAEASRSTVGFGTGRDVKYEEATTFHQQDSWNAYVVAVAAK